jgi:hypothetical protein
VRLFGFLDRLWPSKIGEPTADSGPLRDILKRGVLRPGALYGPSRTDSKAVLNLGDTTNRVVFLHCWPKGLKNPTREQLVAFNHYEYTDAHDDHWNFWCWSTVPDPAIRTLQDPTPNRPPVFDDRVTFAFCYPADQKPTSWNLVALNVETLEFKQTGLQGRKFYCYGWCSAPRPAAV